MLLTLRLDFYFILFYNDFFLCQRYDRNSVFVPTSRLDFVIIATSFPTIQSGFFDIVKDL